MSIAQALHRLVGAGADLAVEAFDGSVAGAPDAPVRVRLNSPRALSYLASSPGQLGLARAYVSGELDATGDMYTVLTSLSAASVSGLSWRDRLEVARVLGPAAVRRVPPPAQEVRLRGRRHSRRRDAQAIRHHYDVSNRFYAWLLGPSMTYTCACFPDEAASLEQAQFDKYDLVARKLRLAPGMRLLDVGCGWGGMVLHAAQHYGVRSLGVTLSRQQADWAQKAIAEAGLAELAEVRYADYRDVRESGFDVVSSIGLTEHIGKAQLPAYFRFLYGKLRPQGRLLNHAIMRPNTTDPAIERRGFIHRYVFPDGELEGLGHIVSAMTDAGFEVRHEENLREHYARTLTHWSANLDAHWAEAVAEVGEATARVWRLYLAGSRWGFETNRIQLHQVLGVRPDENGRSGFPLRPEY